MDNKLIVIMLEWILGLMGVGLVGVGYMALKVREIATDVKHMDGDIETLWIKHDTLEKNLNDHKLKKAAHG